MNLSRTLKSVIFLTLSSFTASFATIGCQSRPVKPYANGVSTGSAQIAVPSAGTAQEEPWSALALKAIDDIHRELAANHPGAIDPQNPDFAKWLESGYTEAKARAQKIKTFPDLKTVLFTYLNGFQDGHVSLNFKVNETTVDWAGIILRSSMQKLQVQFIDSDFYFKDLLVGDELVSCDDKTPQEIFREQVLPVHGIKGLLASYQNMIPFLFVYDSAFGLKNFTNCDFSRNGRVKTVPIVYNRQDRPRVWEDLMRETQPPEHAFGIKKLADQTAWISLPNFGAKTDKRLQELKKTIEDAKSLRSEKNIVIDLRGNTGGNSQWGDDLLSAIYSKDYFLMAKAKMPQSNVQYRVSTGNLEYLDTMIKFLTYQVGADSDITKTMTSVKARMQEALTQTHAPFVSEEDPKAQRHPVLVSNPPPAPAFLGKLIVLTDYKCFSSCLGFMDEVLHVIPNTVHVGLETDADTAYMESKPTDIASGLAELRHPIKVKRAQLRKNNVPYRPKYTFDGNINDTAAVEKWVLGLVSQANF